MEHLNVNFSFFLSKSSRNFPIFNSKVEEEMLISPMCRPRPRISGLRHSFLHSFVSYLVYIAGSESDERTSEAAKPNTKLSLLASLYVLQGPSYHNHHLTETAACNIRFAPFLSTTHFKRCLWGKMYVPRVFVPPQNSFTIWRRRFPCKWRQFLASHFMISLNLITMRRRLTAADLCTFSKELIEARRKKLSGSHPRYSLKIPSLHTLDMEDYGKRPWYWL